MGTIRAQQKAQTRQALLREARDLFAARGYADVSLSDVVAAAGVTKGALYHHFDGKVSLFRAVLEQVQHDVADAVVAAAGASEDAWTQLVDGCHAFLAASVSADVRQVMLVDGPAVLGWQEWRAADEAASGRHLAGALTALVDAGVIAPQPIAPLTRLLSGAMNEAALWLAGSGNPQDLTDTTAALDRLLGALRNG
ncbi:AcrR family transcriptional regulator [Kineococcus xinjiangensis]|uniref:AcrR family transcriptional regulator n=1 Tax=Kineococcus xinjiangensis TaxID=512762 RepID=A0A2S6IEK1_9ACTN|nr:TetR/AcrR family transcriptional regulator [Kineococcus xinjiangensis]PPK92616.1 AcrR family transcriptional regulator [Kineococcus xinjiangensis]